MGDPPPPPSGGGFICFANNEKWSELSEMVTTLIENIFFLNRKLIFNTQLILNQSKNKMSCL